jgi:anti-sigma factor RsiW
MQQGNSSDRETRLDELFSAYRDACPTPEASANFMPEIWARIEAREVSTNWFGNVAKALVTAGLAASMILGLMVSSRSQSSAFFNATFVDAWQADHVSSLEPLDIDRISYLETQ